MITLLTDFGAADYFVPAVKGVILTINPNTQIIDITHEIAPQDIASAAFTLAACYDNFPPNTIHVAVVDPGVGSARNPIIVKAGKYLFVGPDNGIFSHIYSRESDIRVFRITRDEYFRHPVSQTFHGRDVFAPVAAWLSRGVGLDDLGEEIFDFVKSQFPQPFADPETGKISGRIIYIDRFGNCITNLTARELSPDQPGQSATKLLFAGQEITQFNTHFAQQMERHGLFAYLGSAGYWEIGVWCGSAAEFAGAQVGTAVILDSNNEAHSIET